MFMEAIDKALEKVSTKCKELILQANNKQIEYLATHLSSGKMLRSKLIFYIAGISEDSIALSAVIELIQSASLLHDDVIDNATIRRSKASVNAIFGDKSAIMLGDVLYSKAFFELCNFNSSIAKSISNAVFRLSIGEIEDVSLSSAFHTDENRYLQMCKDKTAYLIAASAESAAILANLPQEKYRIYGENLGIAFQIVDDILDITQDEKTLGKPSMSDFKEGKTTLPYMYLHKRLNKDDKTKLESLFKQTLDDTQISWIKSQMQQQNCLQECIQLARFYADKALDSIKNENNPMLEKVVEQMIYRTK